MQIPDLFNNQTIATVKTRLEESDVMAEMCVSTDLVDEGLMCAGGEVLLAAIAIECLFYVFLFMGGWTLLQRFFRRKARLERMKAKAKSEKWIPHKK